jgi:transcriptional regulator with XRE-family HTH domain
MDLRSYRELRGLTLADVAEFLGVSNAKVVHRHEEGSRMPRPALIDKYHKLTGGAVTVDDFLAVHRRWKKAQARKDKQAA